MGCNKKSKCKCLNGCDNIILYADPVKGPTGPIGPTGPSQGPVGPVGPTGTSGALDFTFNITDYNGHSINVVDSSNIILYRNLVINDPPIPSNAIGVALLDSNNALINNMTTFHQYGVIASSLSTAGGLRSIVMTSDNATAGGINSSVIASSSSSNNSVISNANGDYSTVIGTLGGQVFGKVSGIQSSVNSIIENSCTGCNIIASNGTNLVNASTIKSANFASIIGSENVVINGTNQYLYQAGCLFSTSSFVTPSESSSVFSKNKSICSSFNSVSENGSQHSVISSNNCTTNGNQVNIESSNNCRINQDTSIVPLVNFIENVNIGSSLNCQVYGTGTDISIQSSESCSIYSTFDSHNLSMMASYNGTIGDLNSNSNNLSMISTNSSSIIANGESNSAIIADSGRNVTLAQSRTLYTNTIQQVGGCQMQGKRTLSSNDTLTIRDYIVLINASSGNVVVSLPSAADAVDGQVYVLRRVDTTLTTVTITPDATHFLDISSAPIPLVGASYTLMVRNTPINLVFNSFNLTWYNIN